MSKGQGVLPNEHGQVWREYDISPYTLRVRDVAKPEQAIIDWILRETGTEVWFAEPLGILNASSTTLRVYHTPEMHERVRGIVERFVGGDAEAHALGVRLMTVGSPNWRRAGPVAAQAGRCEIAGRRGVAAVARERGGALSSSSKPRADFREHSAPRVEIANGQSQTLARTQPRPYTRGVQLKREFPFYDLIPGKIDEGYSLRDQPADVARWPDDGGGHHVQRRSGRKARAAGDRRAGRRAVAAGADSGAAGGELAAVRAVPLAGQRSAAAVVRRRGQARAGGDRRAVGAVAAGSCQQPGRRAADDRASAAERHRRCRRCAASHRSRTAASREASRTGAAIGTPTGSASSVSRGRY